MTDKNLEQLSELSAYLAARRKTILQDWREAANRDPEQTTVSATPDASSGLLSPDFPYQFHGDSQTSPPPAPPR